MIWRRVAIILYIKYKKNVSGAVPIIQHGVPIVLQTDLGPETAVAYVDVLEGEKEGFVRFKDTDSATKVIGHSWPHYHFTLLTGKNDILLLFRNTVVRNLANCNGRFIKILISFLP